MRRAGRRFHAFSAVTRVASPHLTCVNRLSLTCREFADFLADYYEGELPSPRRLVFDEHLRRCAACVAYLASYRSTVRLAALYAERSLSPPDVPESLLQAVLAGLRTDD